MPTATIKVSAVPGKLLPDIRHMTRSQRVFVGWREVARAPDGSYAAEGEHVISAAPGVRVNGESKWISQSSDLFVEGFEVRLTHKDASGDPLVVEVPDSSYFRRAILEGDIIEAAEQGE